MSEAKSEEATPKTERRARERGRVWQSRDLSLAAVLLGASLAIGLGRDALAPRLMSLMRAPFAAIEAGDAPSAAAMAMVTDGAALLAPLLVVLVALGTLAGVLQVGPLFATRAVEADPSRLDPSARFFELFGRRTAATFAMTLVRLALAGAVVLVTLREALPGIATLARQTETAAFDACFSVSIALLFRVGLAMAALGAVDAVLERTLYRRSLRMSRREVERERRESDGDEHVRRERERVRSEIQGHDVDVSVAGARLVITAGVLAQPPANGSARRARTESGPRREPLIEAGALAIALSYDAADAEAVPRLAAIGRGALSERIVEVADAHRIPRVTDDDLAAQLAIVPLGHPIPEALYEPVARRMHEMPETTT